MGLSLMGIYGWHWVASVARTRSSGRQPGAARGAGTALGCGPNAHVLGVGGELCLFRLATFYWAAGSRGYFWGPRDPGVVPARRSLRGSLPPKKKSPPQEEGG